MKKTQSTRSQIAVEIKYLNFLLQNPKMIDEDLSTVLKTLLELTSSLKKKV